MILDTGTDFLYPRIIESNGVPDVIMILDADAEKRLAQVKKDAAGLAERWEAPTTREVLELVSELLLILVFTTEG